MRIATVIPAYNASATLAEALDSIGRQTMPPEEIIVVDAGSTDETIEVAQAHPLKPRVASDGRLICGDARNLGVKTTEAPWIAFLDADDIWDASHLERGVRAIEAHDGHLYLANFRKIWTRDDMEDRPPMFGMARTDPPRVITRDVLREAVLGVNNGWHMQGMIVERTAYVESGGCDSSMKLRQDAEWFLRTAKDMRWIYNPMPTWSWRFINPASSSTRRAEALLYWMRGHAQFRDWLAGPEYDRLMARYGWETTRLAVMERRSDLHADIRRFCLPWIPGLRGACARLALRLEMPARMFWALRYRDKPLGQVKVGGLDR